MAAARSAAPQPLDEAAIRADERAKVEAEVVAYIDASSADYQRKSSAKEFDSDTRRTFGQRWVALRGVAWDIAAGKHRSTP